MKTKPITIILLCFLLFYGSTQAFSQALNSYGLTFGVTRSTEKWDSTNYSQKMRFRNGLNGSFFLEFYYHDRFTWRTELMYNQKGAKLLDTVFSVYAKSRTNYACWNNYLRIRHEMYDYTPYILIGPRVEYLVSASGTPSHPPAKDFSAVQPILNMFHISAAIGAGCEYNAYDPWILFAEFYYNRDVTNAYSAKDFSVRNRNYELKVGIKRKLNSMRDFEKCPPVYL